MSQITALILAGGVGERMNSRKPDILHEVCGKPILDWVFDSIKQAGIDNPVVLTDGNIEIKNFIGGRLRCIDLHEQGCGSVYGSVPFSHEFEDNILVIAGNMPFIKATTLKEIVNAHLAGNSDYTACCCNSAGIATDFTHNTNSGQQVVMLPVCCNSAVFNRLFNIIRRSGKITDWEAALSELNKGRFNTGYYHVSDPVELLAVGDRLQLALANSIMRQKIIDRHMLKGVSVIDTLSTYIDADVEIGRDTVLYPGTILEKGTVVGEECIIGPNSRLRGCSIGDRVEIACSVVLDSKVGNDTKVGPFAYIRPESEIGEGVKVGGFVEVKKSFIGDGSRIPHLTYVGDATVGRNVNVGCGVVFANFNGREKNRTVVKDNAFIGCNVNLVSPVTVNENAYIAAGSTITEEVPANSLAIARSPQINKKDWVIKKGFGFNKNTV